MVPFKFDKAQHAGFGLNRADKRKRSGTVAVAAILPFLKAHDGTFDPEVTDLMGEAFDAACAILTGLSSNNREAIAERIIEAAAGGERDPIRLRNAGLGALRPR